MDRSRGALVVSTDMLRRLTNCRIIRPIISLHLLIPNCWSHIPLLKERILHEIRRIQYLLVAASVIRLFTEWEYLPEQDAVGPDVGLRRKYSADNAFRRHPAYRKKPSSTRL